LSQENESSEEEMTDDHSHYDDIDFEGVEYLEDENTGKIYNPNHQFVGSWNSTMDDIVWVNDSFKIEHQSKRG
jgi:hypothetical protein